MSVQSLSQVSAPHKLSILIVGPPGSGKTTLACTMPGRTRFLDVDRKLDQALPFIRRHLPHRVDHIEFVQFDPTYTGSARIPIHSAPSPDKPKEGFDPRIAPKAYQQIVNEINGYYELEKLPFDTLVIDSYTRVAEHMKTLIRKLHQHAAITERDWDAILTNHHNFISGVVGLPCNTIVICHERPLIDEVSGIVHKYVPAIQGQFSNVVASYFQEVYFTIPRVRDGKMEVTVLTQNSGVRDARSAYSELAQVPADLSKIFGR